MCGIVGLISKQGLYPEAILRGMTRSIAHRGPDGEGVRIQGPVGLGHRRLSIIDPTGGHQPMCNEDETVWITFNGEIYNFKELMAQLQAKGHQFKTRSDTEVVIHAWEEWGDCCVDHFRGMFAFGIADYREGCVFLARDHFGIKPLVWCETEAAVSFGSELAPLFLTPGFDGSLDLQGLDQYLWLQYIPAPNSAYRQIRKLPPAHRLRVGFDGKVEKPRRYWSIRFAPEAGLSEKAWEERVAAAVKESVDAHLMSDVPFGAFLSGGVDSSLVVAEMSEILTEPVRTFSIGFKEAEFDETSYAAFAAKTCGTQHTRGEMGSDALALLPDLVRHYGEPFGDSSALPTWHVCKLARASVPMVLSGDGADELFAGYGTQGAWMNAPTHNVYDWINQIQYTNTQVRTALWRPEFRSHCQPRLELFERLWAETRGLSDLNRVQHMDVNTYLPFDILTKVDIASMMHGLEARTPFIDLRVVEEATRIPSHFSMVKGADGAWNRKALLKKVARRFFPEEFLVRPKMGFAMPVAKWLAPGGEAFATLVERLAGPHSLMAEYFQPEVLHALLAHSATPTLWLLLFLEEWLRQQKDLPRTRPDTPPELRAASQPAKEPAPVDLLVQAEEEARRGDLEAARKAIRQVLVRWPGSPEGAMASQWLAEHPRVPGHPRPRILLIADVPNWIFERHARALKARLARHFQIEIAYVGQPIDEHAYDLIHPLEWSMVDPALIRTPAKWVTGIRSHTSWEGKDVPAFSAFLASHFQGGVYVVSERLKSIFQPGLPEVHLLPHGIDTTFFRPEAQPAPEAGKLRVGWAGNRAYPVKGFAEFIEPLGKLPGVEVVFCGYSDRLLDMKEMRAFYAVLDAYICTSASEGHNNSLMEAAAMERAIVTTDVGTVPEYLQEGVSALIVPREAKAIQRAIEKLRDDPALRLRLGKAARGAVSERFEWTTCAEAYREFFQAAIVRAKQAPTAPPALGPEALLFDIDWASSEWIEVVLSYVEAFAPGESVALVLSLDPAGPGLEEVQDALIRLIAQSGREAFPDIALVARPEEFLDTLRAYPHAQWIPSGKGRVDGLEGAFGARFASARQRMNTGQSA